ncbi:transcriptional regulatory [Fusarium subglutinans]|uniref:Transcriptional regulatory n=1 Tax=Gibberella subglutinans TaxID=42677 RepID=A0A8H5V4N5_GIBSU|nr:transcriptional regulatory [Fusarium subglutinans]KAF5610501.1 transcriptional regulatory [Fusarium subglutinans]
MPGLVIRLCKSNEIGKIASQLRIQSILSPTDPEGDNEPNVSPKASTTPKRKLEELSSAHEGTSPASIWHAQYDEQSRPDAGDDNSLGRLTPSISVEKAGSRGSRTKQPIRSSIACLRCRRSKIKCDNDGGNTPSSSTKTKRFPRNSEAEKEPQQEKKRARKVDDKPRWSSEKSAVYAAEVLAYPFLTTDLWDQLLNIYKLHYATELPFLHLPSLKEKMSSGSGQGKEYSSELNLVLLGILMLTARFHPDLVRYVTHLPSQHSSNTRSPASKAKSGPLYASDFFATALTTALGPLRAIMDTFTVERIQSFLMLGLFEWSQENNSSAWMYLGIAIRMAKLIGLEQDDRRMAILENQASDTTRFEKKSPEIAIIRETRRRTMYSCFILDRLMSCGSDRPLSIAVDSMLIQSPCSEMAFDLSLQVYTGLLQPHEGSSRPQINDDSTLSRFVKLIEIWGEISRYSSMGGRSQEAHPPWDTRSTFYKLRDKIVAFDKDLPETFRLSRQNYYRHDNHQATNTYVSLHMLASVCHIVLNREYLPFLPLQCRRPQGPIANQTVLNFAPDRFWEESAEDIFESSRNIIDLVGLSKEKLPLSSLSIFSIWLVGFMSIYAHHFPQMDRSHRLGSEQAKSPQTEENLSILEQGQAGIACQALRRAAVYLPSSQRYLDNLEAVDRCFTQAKNSRQGSLSLRLGGVGHGSEPYQTGSQDRQHRGVYDAHRKSISPMSVSPKMRNSPRPILEEPSKPNSSTSKSQLSLPGVDEELLAMDTPKLLLDNVEILESGRMSWILDDLEGFSGAGSLRVTLPNR